MGFRRLAPDHARLAPAPGGEEAAGLLVRGPEVEVVIFDLDGTLVDSEAGIVASYCHALTGLGLELDEKAVRHWIGPPVARGLTALGVAPHQLEAAVQSFRDHQRSVGIYQSRLFDGTGPMLSDLQAAGKTLAIATSKLVSTAELVVAHFGIARHFVAVSGAAPNGTRTNKSDIVAHALSNLGWPDPAGVAMVGDRDGDMYAAIEHGLAPLGAGWGYGSAEELQRAGARWVVESPQRLAELVAPAGCPGALGH